LVTTLTTTSGFSALVHSLILKQYEENLRSGPVWLTENSYIPAVYQSQQGNTFTYVVGAYPDVTPVLTPLVEAVSPTAVPLAISSDSFSAAQLGSFFEISDLGQAENPHNLIAVAVERAARQAVYALESTVKAAIFGGVKSSDTYYINGTARSSQATSSIMTGAILKKMAAVLSTANVPRFADGYFRALMHPEVIYDLMVDTAAGGWMDANKYQSNVALLRGEIGSYGGFRILDTGGSNAGSIGGQVYNTAGASSANVFASAFFGPSFIGITPSNAISAYYVAPGGDHTDVLGQRADVGWKGSVGAGLLIAAGRRYCILESGASLN
jgi:N4-gp56 family major capsid protein